MSAARLSPLNVTALALGLAFLYGPILLVVVFSFNASRLATVWAGFSTGAYRGLLDNAALMSALWTSLRIALVSACVATVLGTLAALALVRGGRFLGRGMFTGLLYVPLVLPEVVTGLSLLLLFVALDLGRGTVTVAIAHVTLAMSFVTLVVQARLIGFDRSLEEAARDLGASPLQAFFGVTLPIIAPAVGAGFLLAFTLSLDDLVLASFASGPGSTTLPMYVFGQARRGVTPEINAVSSLLIAAVALTLVTVTLLMKRRAGASLAR
ncbi:ABC transporter permease [Enterovirga rhinocerotis]|uniref:Putrescine transport system permease protein n=1 Tax=Enterovirga rhinocerotis TaxID=1339210 RepID=A0A4R7BUH7_9HYPH|nr:ABC transporter permease [Enterovirga rhinocerotis]TDR89043.1 putrescine transport system permease protein [Enterovirga rhinocerotis]